MTGVWWLRESAIISVFTESSGAWSPGLWEQSRSRVALGQNGCQRVPSHRSASAVPPGLLPPAADPALLLWTAQAGSMGTCYSPGSCLPQLISRMLCFPFWFGKSSTAPLDVDRAGDRGRGSQRAVIPGLFSCWLHFCLCNCFGYLPPPFQLLFKVPRNCAKNILNFGLFNHLSFL